MLETEHSGDEMRWLLSDEKPEDAFFYLKDQMHSESSPPLTASQ